MSVQSTSFVNDTNPRGQAQTQTDIAHAHCPVCEMPDCRALCVVDGFQVLRCAHCATDFAWPAPDDATLRKYYDRANWFEGGERGGYANYDAQTEPQLPFFETILDSFGTDGTGLSVLDIGCGYGTHLDQAHRRGWKCFGVEVSAHAREVIRSRHGHKFFVVEDVEQLIPHKFDLIVLFDVIEHLVDPHRLFYSLFAKGAITPETTIVIATPNARSGSAVSNPAGWAYRHPPSHLVYFSAHSLTTFLQRLHFDKIEVQGTHEEATESHRYTDESFAINDQLTSFAGLLCKASGSNFAGFMQERYVPGTWSKIAEYEHLPRYLFARDIAEGRRTLDFGCGTGYGTSLLSQKAKSVVGLDIDTEALQWAREHHKRSNLSYERHADFGATLPDASFDLITCFEMIEHVAEPAQRETIRNISRMLAPNGLTVISTPNPEITKLYGENPYHIREMNKVEFEELLREHFQYVEIVEQYIQASVLIARNATSDQATQLRHLSWDAAQAAPEPAVYIALCSHTQPPKFESANYIDFRTNFIQQELATAGELNRARFDYFQAAEQAASKEVMEELHARTVRVSELETELHARNLRVNDLEQNLHARNLQTSELGGELHARNLRVMELDGELHQRNLRIVELETALNSSSIRIQDLEKFEAAAKAELARYNWLRKIDRLLFKRR